MPNANNNTKNNNSNDMNNKRKKKNASPNLKEWGYQVRSGRPTLLSP